MVRQVEAIYENGSLRLLGPVDLQEGERVTVALRKSVPRAPKCGQELAEFFERISASADLPPDDHFSGEDHDQVLYGWEKSS